MYYGEPKKPLLSDYLTDFLVHSCTFICLDDI
jgi:hypothetical protein